MAKKKPATTAPKQASRLSDRVGNVHVPVQRRETRLLRARYDNAATTDDNRRYWANASDLAPDQLGSADVRAKLRVRCRYECRNNSWAKGIRDTIANDTIGTGPRLQLLTDDAELNEAIETDFWDWSEEVGLAEKLRTMRAARIEAGEIFGLIASNMGLAHDVKLDLTLVEPEQVISPFSMERDLILSDGIEYDANGNPARYWVLKDYPGTGTAYSAMRPEDFDIWPARYVLHYFRPDRAGQARGVPDLTPALDQFAELHRYCKVAIRAAESIADHAIVIYTDAPPDPDAEDQTTVEAMDTFELTRGIATTLPQGYKIGQPEAVHPTDTYAAFVKCKVAEVARCLNVPYYIAALDTDSNMSSAYVVGQKYERTISVDRSEFERLLNRLVDVWLTEWILINRPTELPDRINRFWQWDEIGNHADPAKVANARSIELIAGTTNIPREYARKGLDWEDEQEADAKSMGITIEKYRELLVLKRFGPTTPQPADAQPADTSNTETETADA